MNKDKSILEKLPTPSRTSRTSLPTPLIMRSKPNRLRRGWISAPLPTSRWRPMVLFPIQ
jgi:hypothetical protein